MTSFEAPPGARARYQFKIKRIIGGKTYNTETATEIAQLDRSDQQYDFIDSIFKTRFGAYFHAWYNQGMEYNEYEDYLGITPMSSEECQEWFEEHLPNNPDIIEREFGSQPEAGDTESRFTLRMPDSLKGRIDALASSQKRSTNAWVIRCLERCALAQEQENTND